VLLIPGFTPAAGQSFDIMDWGSLSGTFSSLILPTLTVGLAWDSSQLYTTGALKVVSTGLPGDYNYNGIVDEADYVVWRKMLGQTGAGLAADGNNDGVVNQADFNIWRAHFGQIAGSGAGSSEVRTRDYAIPEPATDSILLFSFGTLLLTVSRRYERR